MKRFYLCLLTCLHIALYSEAQYAARDMISAERAFAKRAFETSVREAFLQCMFDKSVVDANKQFVPGIAYYEKQASDSSGKLVWSPAFAAMAASGDLGYTTGPWTYRSGANDLATGNFATVWQQQPDGQWKFIIDFGNSFPLAAYQPADSVQILEADKQLRPTNNTIDLISIDKNFSSVLAAGGLKQYRKYLHPCAHLLYPGKQPIINKQQKEAWMAQKRKIVFHQQQSYLSAAADLGVVYGTCDLSPGFEKETTSICLYMHVWRKDHFKGWQLLHETIK